MEKDRQVGRKEGTQRRRGGGGEEETVVSS